MLATADPSLQAGPPATTLPADSQTQQQQQEQQQMYRRFITQRIVKDFTPFSRYLPDLASQAAALWPKYQAAARLAAQQQDADMEDEEVGCMVVDLHKHICL